MSERHSKLHPALWAVPLAAVGLLVAVQSTHSQESAEAASTEISARLPALGAAVALQESDIAARVNGRIIPEASVEAVLAQAPAGEDAPDRATVINDIVDMEILAQEAEAQRLHERPEIAAELMLQYTQTLANAWVEEQTNLAEKDAELLRELYAEQIAGLPNDEYRASHIMLETQAQADSVLEQLNAGGDFNELAASNSIDPQTYLGWITARTAAPEIITALAELDTGAITAAPVETEYGFHLIRLDETRRAPRPDFDAVKPRLVEIVVRETVERRLTELRDAADITGL